MNKYLLIISLNVSGLNAPIKKQNVTEWIKKHELALAGVAQWVECGLQTKGLPVRFPVRAHAWVAAPGPQWGPHERQPHIDISLFFSLPSPLSKNK